MLKLFRVSMRSYQTQTRRVTTLHSPAQPREAEGVQSMASDWRGMGEVLFIAGLGTFGAYEMYKGMFMLPQRAPTQEDLLVRAERVKMRTEEARLARAAAQAQQQASRASPDGSLISSQEEEATMTTEVVPGPGIITFQRRPSVQSSMNADEGTSTIIAKKTYVEPIDPYLIVEQVDKTE